MEEAADEPFSGIADNGGDEDLPQDEMEDAGLTQEAAELPGDDEMPPSPSKLDLAKAQEELSNLDILVCGKCHTVFHFIPELQEHKSSCPGTSNVFNASTKADSKAQVWAFVLYKSAKIKEQGQSGDWSSVSWHCYQKWSKLTDQVKQAWVEAGRCLQQLSVYLPKAAVIPPQPIQKPKQLLTAAERQEQQQTLLELQKELEDDDGHGTNASVEIKEEKKLGVNQVWVKMKNSDDELVLRTIEKIVAKRVNPKLKTPEYLIKWEGMPSDENTWEPVQNLTNCTRTVQEFEKNLAKQKARKAAEASKQQQLLNKPQQFVIQDLGSSGTPGRPIRTSAKKALDQVKEWVKKRPLDSEDEDGDLEEYEPPVKKENTIDLSSILGKKMGGKSPLLLANSGGVVRVDPKQVPNLSSGVYILSSQQGLIKVDDPTAAKLTEAMKVDGRKSSAVEKTIMINETEIRKIDKKQTVYRKDLSLPKRTNALASPATKIIQRTLQPAKSPQIIRVSNPPKPVSTPLGRQIVLGMNKPRPLPGPVASPLKTPLIRQKTVGKPVMTPIRQKPQILQHVQQLRMVTKENNEDMDAGIPDDFPKSDDPLAPASPTRPLTLCPLTGEVLGQVDGDGSAVSQDGEEPLAEADDDGMLRVEMSPGGTIRQVFARGAPKGRSLLSQKRGNKIVEQQVVEPAQEEEMISIESEDGVIYQITPEQQQILLQNGTLTMQEKTDDGAIVLPQESISDEHTEILIENGQIVHRVVAGGAAEGAEQPQEDDQEMMLAGGQQLMEGEDGQVYTTAGNVLTLDSAVQEAVSDGIKQEDGGTQMVAQIVQAEPPTPGGGPRKVVLLLPDGSLVNTEMEEEQYQALDFEK